MLDSEKQKHRDHCKASVARSVLISATERLSELRSSELSASCQRMADHGCTDRVGNAVGHGFWLFADSIRKKIIGDFLFVHAPGNHRQIFI